MQESCWLLLELLAVFLSTMEVWALRRVEKHGSEAWSWRRRTELFSYETCIFYTVLTAIPTLDRVSLKAKVVDAPEILTVIDTIPNLNTFLNALYECRYADFFQVGRICAVASARTGFQAWGQDYLRYCICPTKEPGLYLP